MKTNLSDNVNVKVLPPLDCFALSQILLSDGWTRCEGLKMKEKERTQQVFVLPLTHYTK